MRYILLKFALFKANFFSTTILGDVSDEYLISFESLLIEPIELFFRPIFIEGISFNLIC